MKHIAVIKKRVNINPIVLIREKYIYGKQKNLCNKINISIAFQLIQEQP